MRISKKLISGGLIMILLVAMMGCGKKGYQVDGEAEAKTLYTCPSDNMFGIEKIVVFDNRVAIVLDKDINDESDYGKCKYLIKNDSNQFYAFMTNVSCTENYDSGIKESEGKYIAENYFKYDEDDVMDNTKEVEINGIDLGDGVEIRFNDEQIKLSYTEYGGECIMEYTQTYDFASGSWSEIKDELTTWPYIEENIEENKEENIEETGDVTENLTNKIVEYYTQEFVPEGTYVIFPEETVETDDDIKFILRYQLSDAEEEEMIANGNGPVANKYITTVTYNKSTLELSDENGLIIK